MLLTTFLQETKKTRVKSIFIYYRFYNTGFLLKIENTGKVPKNYQQITNKLPIKNLTKILLRIPYTKNLL